jgi:hypothetical protein
MMKKAIGMLIAIFLLFVISVPVMAEECNCSCPQKNSTCITPDVTKTPEPGTFVFVGLGLLGGLGLNCYHSRYPKPGKQLH